MASRRMRMWVGGVLSLCVVAGTAAAGPLNGHADALPGWTGALSGQYTSGQTVLSVILDYAVFGPGDYPGQVPGWDTEYVYAYQVFNQPASTVALTFLSVGLEAGSAAGNPGDDPSVVAGVPGAPGGIAPDLASIGTSSARWGWGFGMFPSPEVGVNEHSTVLVFTSPNEPQYQPTTLADGGVPVPIGLAPSPMPEPVTMTLISLGGILLVGRRRRTRN